MSGYKCVLKCRECEGGRCEDHYGRMVPCEVCEGHGEIDFEIEMVETLADEAAYLAESDLVPALMWCVAAYVQEGFTLEWLHEQPGIKAIRERLETPKRKVRRAA